MLDSLYKFIGSKAALKPILNGKLKFSTIKELNDPTELIPFFDREIVMKSLYEKRKKGYKESDLKLLKYQEEVLAALSPTTMALKSPKTVEAANATLHLPIYDNLEFLEKQLKKTTKSVIDCTGVLCLTTRINSLPMWAHYANNANGYAVEYSKLEEVFNNEKESVFGNLVKVEYQENRATMTFEPDTFRGMFFSKFDDWSYENEIRVVLPLRQCELQDNLHLKTISKNHIKSIILGWRMSEEDQNEIISTVKDINSNVKIKYAKIENGKISIKEQN